MYRLLIINPLSLVDIQKSIQLIVDSLDIPTEIVDQSDDRLKLYAERYDRFPIFILFKNDVKLSVLYGKYSKEYIKSWIKSKTP